MLEKQIEVDVKTAMLAGESLKVTTLRNLKSALLNVKVASGKRESGLDDNEVMAVLSKESKKRQESADLYIQGGDKTRADQELKEKYIIDAYLPAPISEAEIVTVVDDIIRSSGASSMSDMGKVIGAVKTQLGSAADGSLIARIVKERIQS